MADTTPKSYSADSTLYLYTSLTGGSSHLITATARLVTILNANKVSFSALDVATDEKARMLWGRRSKGKKLPGLVRYGSVVGDLEEIEEWNEYGELKQKIGCMPVSNATPMASATNTPSRPNPVSLSGPGTTSNTSSDVPSPPARNAEMSEQLDPSLMGATKKGESSLTMALRQAGAEAAKKAGEKKLSKPITQSSAKDQKATVMPIPGSETKMAKLAEQPGALADATAAKVPEKLAEEGAKRTSVDKIAEEGVKRTSLDRDTEPDSTDEQGYVGLSKEATLLEARLGSSVTKINSPLSEGTAATSRDEGQESGESDSSSEEKEDPDKSKTKARAQATGAPLNSVAGNAEQLNPAEATMKSVTATDEAEDAAMKGLKPQEQDAKDGQGAGLSVAD